MEKNDQLTVLVVQNEIKGNGGYATPVELTNKLILHKNGVIMELTPQEMAKLYNTIRPISAPRLETESY